ncbi:MAG: trans-sulfuration enzyme family protein [Candidatus Methanofastidiosia archaeon]
MPIAILFRIASTGIFLRQSIIEGNRLERRFISKRFSSEQVIPLKGFSTKCVHQKRIDTSKVTPHVIPIFQTVNFDYKTQEEARSIIAGEKKGYVYTRYGNPTIDSFNSIICELEKGEAALSFASGMASISSSILALVKAKDHIVASKILYGGTYEFLTKQLSDMKISVTFVDFKKLEDVENSIVKNTKIIYTEPLSNPTLNISDISSISEIAKDHNVMLLVDNTFTPPPIFQPLKFGADVCIHSATKYFSGHGDVVGGVVVGKVDFIEKLSEVMKYYGGIMSPFNAWLLLRGVKTLALRMEKHSENALKVARFLENHKKVKKVNYPGLKSHSQHVLAKKMFSNFGGMLSFEVEGGYEGGCRFMDALELCKITVSLGEVETLVIHPASSSHAQMPKVKRKKIGITDGLVRISCGIEDVEDIIEDLEKALEKV